MILYILLVSVLAWSTGKCEPPVNSYLPPSTGNAGNPSSQYGLPEVGGNGRPSNAMTAGNRQQNKPHDSYSIPGRSDSSRQLDTEYGPPSVGRGSGQGSIRPSHFGSPSHSDFHAPTNNKEPSKQYGVPNGVRRPGNGPLNQAGQSPQSFNGPIERPQSSYNSPRGSGIDNSEPSGRNNGFDSSGSRFGQRPDSSYGPPPSGDLRTQNGDPLNHSPQAAQGSPFSAPLRDNGASSFNNKTPLSGSLSSAYGTPGFNKSPGGRGSDDNTSSFGGESGEPAKYEFSYDVDDAQSGTKFGHSEQRDGDTATGQYNVELPDGRKQVVEYEAGLQGYKPQIRYEGGRNGAAAGSFGNGNNGIQGGNRGYPREGPGSNSNDIGYPESGQDGRLGKYQQTGNFDQNGPELGGRDFMGYPKRGTGSTGETEQENRGYTGGNPGISGSHYPSGNVDNISENLNGGVQGGTPFASADNRGNEGYPRGHSQERTDVRGSTGYSRGGPQENNENYSQDNTRQFLNEGAEGFHRGQSNKGASESNRNSGNEGYPRGGPSGPRGSGY